MFTAAKLRQENIAEYLLYMWQVEDLIRACGLDIDKIKSSVIEPLPLDADGKRELCEWYSDLIDMMRLEGVAAHGHLQINKNVLIQLTDLHIMLLKSVKYPEYSAEFYRTLPMIVELRAKSGDDKPGEIETCFNALYGLLMMRLQKRDITDETQNAMSQISRFVSILASYYHKDKKEPLFGKEDYDNL